MTSSHSARGEMTCLANWMDNVKGIYIIYYIIGIYIIYIIVEGVYVCINV